MTAEIALINKLAVTLAADSAVTISNSEGPKVYNSADKIFETTNYDPIGVMVYNKPNFNGIPIETIIKMYRDEHCKAHHRDVFEFAEQFLDHLSKIDTPDITISENILSLTYDLIYELREEIRSIITTFLQTAENLETIEEFREALEQEIRASLDGHIKALELLPDPEWAAKMSVDDIMQHHGEDITSQIVDIFESEAFPPFVSELVESIVALALLKDFQKNQLMGLVFAGFGKEEIFPSLVSYQIYGMIGGKLKFEKVANFNVDRKLRPDAAVIPFAQKEMVDRFMYGIDDEFLQLSGTFFGQSHQLLKEHLAPLLAELDEDARNAANAAVDAISQEFSEKVLPDHLERLRSQFSDMVRSMPKQELAALAESLVHITSLKRKFSAGAESVGGPIDVAMITRAEGFVWVQRKHYFDPQFNPRYFHRRYGKAKNEESKS